MGEINLDQVVGVIAFLSEGILAVLFAYSLHRENLK